MATIPTSSLRTFLALAKSALRTAVAKQQQVNLVIGNESADLDSITSSILYAYFRSIAPRSSRSPWPYIPLLNIPSDDIKLRLELIYLLPHANLETSQLITLDHLPPSSIAESQTYAEKDQPGTELLPENTNWILVDHNSLQPPLKRLYSTRVIGCIDHHNDEKTVPTQAPTTPPEPRIVQKCGSCTSLVIQHFRDSWDSFTSQTSSVSGSTNSQGDAGVVGTDDVEVRRTWDAQVAKFALASILVDTQDLTDESKVTEEDEKAVNYLEAKISRAPSGGATFDRHQFFAELSRAKSDMDSLGLEDVLRKDYKQWSEGERRLGVSSVVKSLNYLIKKGAASKEDAEGVSVGQEVVSEFRHALRKFAQERKLDVFAIMTTSTSSSGDFKRELLVMPLDSSMEQAMDQFSKKAGSILGLETWHQVGVLTNPEAAGSIGSLKIWQQKDVTKSRKQVAPLLRDALK